MIKLYIDGGCSGNSQLDLSLREMVWVVTDERGKVLVEEKASGGSNNIAEFLALRDCLKWLKNSSEREAIVFTDSMINLSWFRKKKWKEKQKRAMNDFQRVQEIKNEIEELKRSVKIDLQVIPREQNKAGWYIEEKCGL